MNFRSKMIAAARGHAIAHVEKHKMNVEVLLANPVGVGNNGDIIDERFIMARFSNKIQEEIEKELDEMAKYNDHIEMLDKYFNQ